MRGAIDGDRGDAVAQSLVEESLSGRGGIDRIGKLRFLGEGVFLKPFEELSPV
jgi:hypothetical protein